MNSDDERILLIYLPVLPVSDSCLLIKSWEVYCRRLILQKKELALLWKNVFAQYRSLSGHNTVVTNNIPSSIVCFLRDRLYLVNLTVEKTYKECQMLYFQLRSFSIIHGILNHMQQEDVKVTFPSEIECFSIPMYERALDKIQECDVYWSTRLLILNTLRDNSAYSI